MQDSHAGTAQFPASGNMGLIIAGIIFLLPFVYSNIQRHPKLLYAVHANS